MASPRRVLSRNYDFLKECELAIEQSMPADGGRRPFPEAAARGQLQQSTSSNQRFHREVYEQQMSSIFKKLTQRLIKLWKETGTSDAARAAFMEQNFGCISVETVTRITEEIQRYLQIQQKEAAILAFIEQREEVLAGAVTLAQSLMQEAASSRMSQPPDAPGEWKFGMTAEPLSGPQVSADARQKLERHLHLLRGLTLAILLTLRQWRTALSGERRVFAWNGRPYISKMTTDTRFLRSILHLEGVSAILTDSMLATPLLYDLARPDANPIPTMPQEVATVVYAEDSPAHRPITPSTAAYAAELPSPLGPHTPPQPLAAGALGASVSRMRKALSQSPGLPGTVEYFGRAGELRRASPGDVRRLYAKHHRGTLYHKQVARAATIWKIEAELAALTEETAPPSPQAAGEGLPHRYREPMLVSGRTSLSLDSQMLAAAVRAAHKAPSRSNMASSARGHVEAPTHLARTQEPCSITTISPSRPQSESSGDEGVSTPKAPFGTSPPKRRSSHSAGDIPTSPRQAKPALSGPGVPRTPGRRASISLPAIAVNDDLGDTQDPQHTTLADTPRRRTSLSFPNAIRKPPGPMTPRRQLAPISSRRGLDLLLGTHRQSLTASVLGAPIPRHKTPDPLSSGDGIALPIGPDDREGSQGTLPRAESAIPPDEDPTSTTSAPSVAPGRPTDHLFADFEAWLVRMKAMDVSALEPPPSDGSPRLMPDSLPLDLSDYSSPSPRFRSLTDWRSSLPPPRRKAVARVVDRYAASVRSRLNAHSSQHEEALKALADFEEIVIGAPCREWSILRDSAAHPEDALPAPHLEASLIQARWRGYWQRRNAYPARPFNMWVHLWDGRPDPPRWLRRYRLELVRGRMGMEVAVIPIQCLARGFLARRRPDNPLVIWRNFLRRLADPACVAAAQCIQRAFRAARRRASNRKERERRGRAAIALQSLYRGHQVRTQVHRLFFFIERLSWEIVGQVLRAARTLQRHFRRHLAARRSARVQCVQQLCRYHLAWQRVEALRLHRASQPEPQPSPPSSPDGGCVSAGVTLLGDRRQSTGPVHGQGLPGWDGSLPPVTPNGPKASAPDSSSESESGAPAVVTAAVTPPPIQPATTLRPTAPRAPKRAASPAVAPPPLSRGPRAPQQAQSGPNRSDPMQTTPDCRASGTSTDTPARPESPCSDSSDLDDYNFGSPRSPHSRSPPPPLGREVPRIEVVPAIEDKITTALSNSFLALPHDLLQRLVAIFAPKVVEPERWPLVLCLQRHCRNLGLRGICAILLQTPCDPTSGAAVVDSVLEVVMKEARLASPGMLTEKLMDNFTEFVEALQEPTRTHLLTALDVPSADGELFARNVLTFGVTQALAPQTDAILLEVASHLGGGPSPPTKPLLVRHVVRLLLPIRA